MTKYLATLFIGDTPRLRRVMAYWAATAFIYSVSALIVLREAGRHGRGAAPLALAGRRTASYLRLAPVPGARPLRSRPAAAAAAVALALGPHLARAQQPALPPAPPVAAHPPSPSARAR